MKSIRCSFFVASILILITQMAIAQGSESFNGQAWFNKKDDSMIIKLENLDMLEESVISKQATPDIKLPTDYSDLGETDKSILINAPIESEKICVKYPFVEGCSQ